MDKIMILDKTLCHLRNFLLRSESTLTDWCGKVKFSDSAVCVAKYWRHIHSAIKKPNREQRASNVTPSNRTEKNLDASKRSDLRNDWNWEGFVYEECSSWRALQNASQFTLFYSVTWRNEMIYTHRHVTFCRLNITVGYLSVDVLLYLWHFLQIPFIVQAYQYW